MNRQVPRKVEAMVASIGAVSSPKELAKRVKRASKLFKQMLGVDFRIPEAGRRPKKDMKGVLVLLLSTSLSMNEQFGGRNRVALPHLIDEGQLEILGLIPRQHLIEVRTAMSTDERHECFVRMFTFLFGREPSELEVESSHRHCFIAHR
jgi:hypothetical protein